jgi:hypothetical protein
VAFDRTPAPLGSTPILAAVRPGRIRADRAGKRGNPPKAFSPAGDALARNCRKAPQIGLMIAKTLFLT